MKGGTGMYSMLMSVYKKEKAENLRLSVESMMKQTVPPDDAVLYCDGRLTKELYDTIDRLKERYDILNVLYNNENIGLGKALAKCLKSCKYEIVARMDSDDIAFPDRMERQLEAFSRFGADIVSGTVEEFEGDTGNIIGIKSLPQYDEQIKKYARKRNPFNQPCVAFKKESVLKAGNYQHCPYFEDYWLWLRMLKNGCVGYNVPKAVLHMRSGEQLYMRRGGKDYICHALNFRKMARRSGFCSMTDYITACTGHIVAAAVPNKLRMIIYSKVLRK